MLPGADDTIVALATTPGRSAIAVVRIGGRGALTVAGRLVSPWPITERHPTLCEIRHPDTGALLDRALVTTFPDARSFTGEPIVEISTHGGLLVPTTTLDAVLAAGARFALPGEFTRRAVFNGRIDLLQAEAIGDLIDARSGATQRSALRQLDGGLSRRILELRERIIGIEAMIAYDIDFPDEDDGPIPAARVREAGVGVLDALDRLLATAHAGVLIREGALIVLAGAPNAGKSSLFNALVGESRAIVTDVPGTTRDAIEAVVDATPWPLRLVDTAGLRPTADVVERLGVEVSERYLGAADLILACAESPAELADTMHRIRVASSAPMLAVATKQDLVSPGDEATWDLVAGSLESRSPPSSLGFVPVSALTGAGLQQLMAEIGRILSADGAPPAAETPLLTRERHHRAVATARTELAAFLSLRESGDVPASVAAVHLRTATVALEELIGSVDVEDIFDRVFASFCIGK